MTLLTGAACGTETSREIAGPSGESLPYTIDESSTFGPRTALFSGFQVAEGSWLFGAPFPRHVVINIPENERINQPASMRDAYGWEAVLGLTGGTKDVVEEYLQQSSDLGFAQQESRCERNNDVTVCDGSSRRNREGSAAQELFTVRSVAGGRGETAEAFVHLDLDGLSEPPTAGRGLSHPEPQSPNHAKGELPGPGERFGGASPSQNAAESQRVFFRVAKGTHLVAPPYIDTGAIPGPIQYAVLRVTGSTAVVKSDYDEQAAQRFPTKSREENWSLHGASVSQSRFYCAGGCGNHDTLLFGPQRGRMFILLKSGPRS
jgi:hypothetical protein